MRFGDSLRMTLARCRIWLFYQRLFFGLAGTVARASGCFSVRRVAQEAGWLASFRRRRI
jgi:hypothetical protein